MSLRNFDICIVVFPLLFAFGCDLGNGSNEGNRETNTGQKFIDEFQGMEEPEKHLDEIADSFNANIKSSDDFNKALKTKNNNQSLLEVLIDAENPTEKSANLAELIIGGIYSGQKTKAVDNALSAGGEALLKKLSTRCFNILEKIDGYESNKFQINAKMLSAMIGFSSPEYVKDNIGLKPAKLDSVPYDENFYRASLAILRGTYNHDQSNRAFSKLIDAAFSLDDANRDPALNGIAYAVYSKHNRQRGLDAIWHYYRILHEKDEARSKILAKAFHTVGPVVFKGQKELPPRVVELVDEFVGKKRAK